MKKRSIPGKYDLETIRNQILDFACVAHYGKDIQKHKLVDKKLRAKRFDTYLLNFEYIDIKFFIHHIEVLDKIGIASGVFNHKSKAKEYPEVTGKKRWSSIWVKSAGNWKLIFYHRELINNNP